MVLFSAVSFADESKYPPMPPDFSAKTDMQEALLKYPLGVINKEAAFSHHGQATRKVTLPNGNEGWVYQVGEGAGLRTYTLEFNEKGIVTDVLYNEQGRHNGLTALQLQAQAAKVLGPEAEPQPFKKQPPEEFHYQK
ncbi:MAG: hypothetical protein KGJ12_05490 [Gammaproteobacteria bacterium]|nr:hypothetical protein [Gammaproteobacteria bacterium]